ncbi:HbrB-domain-containing protein [Trametes coccinea BRFM310]|uniref:HbrB-domain-containing protein n=1 Tax=Trametes coccinea (strain BRFM310) TaxID=1353009 RepID=A0A1Y2I9F1_TRAC3|nr:HbrB-domain-containing protein [Trametes coccinea BRFM310]
MHRLGNLAHLPSLAPSLSATPSNISLAPPPGAPSASSILAGARPGAEDSPWTSLHVLVLPLFNEEPLRVPIEDLNQLVKRHIQTAVSAAPGKAVATLEHDTYELIAAGMVTLNAKLAGVEDEKLIPRVVELWSTFWTQVLPYLEGSLLPLQTDPILSSLYRLPKARPSSPTSTQNGKPASSSLNVLLQSTAPQIDVRALALVSFRDRVVLPLFPRLYARLTMSKDENPVGTEAYYPRLQQMLLVLVSQRSQRLVSLSLTAPPPQPTAGESAIARLLRAMHAPIVTLAPHYHHHSHHAHARAAALGGGSRRAPPSFLSAGLPRDRRGRIAQKTDVGGGGGGRAKDGVRSRSEGVLYTYMLCLLEHTGTHNAAVFSRDSPPNQRFRRMRWGMPWTAADARIFRSPSPDHSAQRSRGRHRVGVVWVRAPPHILHAQPSACDARDDAPRVLTRAFFVFGARARAQISILPPSPMPSMLPKSPASISQQRQSLPRAASTAHFSTEQPQKPVKGFTRKWAQENGDAAITRGTGRSSASAAVCQLLSMYGSATFMDSFPQLGMSSSFETIAERSTLFGNTDRLHQSELYRPECAATKQKTNALQDVL